MQKMILMLCMLIPMGLTNCKNMEIKFDPTTAVIQKIIKKGVDDNFGRQ